MIFLSPGVKTREVDFSVYASQLSTCAVGIVGPARRGSFTEPTFVSGQADFIPKLGEPLSISHAARCALKFLERGNQLYYFRVGDGTEAYAECTINDNQPTPAPALTLRFKTKGSDGNRVKVTISDVNEKNFSLTVLYDGVAVEKHYCSMLSSEPHYVVKKLASSSQYLDAEDLTESGAVLSPEAAKSLTGGSDGIAALDAGDVVGVNGTGLDGFANVDDYDINLLLAPGYSEEMVVNKLLSVCEGRGDCLAIIDPPQGLAAQEVVDWHNGEGTGQTDPKAALNSSYGALFWPWVSDYDPFADDVVWMPPSGVVAAQIAYSDQVSAPWFAPAGLRRGKVNVLDVEFNADQGTRDLLYGNQNAINVITRFKKLGITIWGNRTLQRIPSATDRINVRRLLLLIRKTIAVSSLYVNFEQIDEYTFNEWVGMVEPFLRSIASRRGLMDFRVLMDWTTVTPFDVDNNRMPGKVLIKPTKSAEFIPIDFVLVPTGAEFPG